MAEPNSKPDKSRSFQAPTGTRDFYPAELNRLRYIQDAWRRTSINHGFEEIDGPTFEHLDLYTVKSGEGIVSELFSFERFGGEKTYALRPEFTPTLARMYASKANALPKPCKWFWQQNCFRAERPQRGRLREFSQWNCDIIGDDGTSEGRAAADAEVIACCVGLLEDLGLTPADVQIRLNDRAAVASLLGECGVAAEEQFIALALLDRRDRIDKADVARQATAIGLDLVRFDDRSARFDASSDAGAALMRNLGDMGLREWVRWDMHIVRGLAYYTGMVFEVHEASGAERAIAGGGRYDGLIELFGGPSTPAVGFGMGDVVLSLVLQDRGKFPKDEEVAEKLGLRPDAFIISNGTPEAEAALAPTLAALRRANLHARRSYKASKNVGKLLQDAAKARARFAVILENGTHATVKNLDTQQQDAAPTPLAQLAERLAR